MVILENNSEYKIHNICRDKNGRYIILNIEMPDVTRFLRINVYAPNKDSLNFCRHIPKDWGEWSRELYLGWRLKFSVKPGTRYLELHWELQLYQRTDDPSQDAKYMEK